MVRVGAGKVSVEYGEQKFERRLATSTLVGRHWHCDIKIDDPRIPLYWLEIRWMGNVWAWRELTDTGSTRGPGLTINNHWRVIKELGKKGPRITHPPDISIQFLDLSGPTLMLEDLTTREQLGPEEVEKHIEVWDQQVHASGWDTHATASEGLQDGDILFINARLFRVLSNQVPLPTAQASLDVMHPDCQLDIDLQELTASFTVSSTEAIVHGEFVRTLFVYAQAREQGYVHDGGWLSRQDAHTQWVALGGNQESPEERIGWDRGKLRTQLSTQGATGLRCLFEKKRSGSDVFIRLNLTPQQIFVSD
jgi:hypothetical protein